VSFDEIAVDYDRMIEWPARLGREIPALTRLFEGRGVRSLVDFGCGPGRHAIELRKLGYRVVGVDSSARMRQLALENSGPEPLEVFEALKHVRGVFDGVMTIGNTLPSIADAQSLRSTFETMHRLTRPGGLILIQVRNYEALTPDQVVTMGLRETAESITFRAYHAEDSHVGRRMIHLHTLTLRGPEGHRSASGFLARIRGWRRKEIAEGLQRAGYRDIGFHSTYALGDFALPSPDLIVTATRGPQLRRAGV